MRGILGPLCDRSPASIHVANRTSQRAIDLVALFEGRGSLTAGGLTTIPDREWGLVINGSSSGWAGDFPELEIPRISPDASAYDLIYSDKPTPFMTWADSRGFQQVSDGLGMLVEQAADSYEIWNAERPLTHDVLAMLRA
jgi:shikimate dehydrogenase